MNFIRRFISSSSPERNARHPDYKKLVEPKFKIKGVQYYAFKDAKDMPHMRIYFYHWYVNQYEMGIDHETLLAYNTRTKECANKGLLGDVIKISQLLEERIKANMGMDILYQIASVFYFTDEEDLEDYSIYKNKSKIESFRRDKDLSFFLTNPMIDFFPHLIQYTQDSKTFLQMVDSIKELTKEIDSLVLSPLDKED
jgi:hypothetical protein